MKRVVIISLIGLFSEGWSASVDNIAQICYLGNYNAPGTQTSNLVSVAIWERLLGKVWDLMTKEGIGTPTLYMAGRTKQGDENGTYTLDPASPEIHTLVVERTGYFPATRTIDLSSQQKQDIGLCPISRYIPANTWKMFSPPALPPLSSQINGNTITVGSDLGGLDNIGNLNIRCYTWDETVSDDPLYGKYIRPFKIETGKSYWFKVYANQANLLADSANINSDTQTISLAKGWNQIGNPFNFMVKKDNILIGTQTLTETDNLWAWTDTEYLSSEAILPWKGYFIYRDSPGTLSILPVPYDDNSISCLSILNVNKYLWSIKLSAQSGIYSDKENLIGIGRNGKEETGHEPPLPFGKFVRLAIANCYAKEIRSQIADSNLWNISITSTTDEPVTLSWSDVSAIPEEYGVWLIDGDNAVDMRKSIVHSPQSTELRIKVAKGGLINERLEIRDLISYPNPSSGEVTFRTTLLTAEANLKVKLYNIVGQVVAETSLISEKAIDEKAQVCIYTSKFSCLNTSNQKLANGLYFFQIEASQDGKAVSKIGRMVISR